MKWLPVLVLCAMAAGCRSVPRESSGGGGPVRGGTRIEKSAVDREIVSRTPNSQITLREACCYSDPMDATHYGNAFRMYNGHIVAICLLALQQRGIYTGDEICIYDLTAERLERIGMSEQVSNRWVIDNNYLATFERTSGDLIIVVSDARVSFNDLFRWRTQGATLDLRLGNTNYRYRFQSYDWAAVVFTEPAAQAWLDPEAKAKDFAPSYAVPTMRKLADGRWEPIQKSAIGDTGYILERQADGHLEAVLAK